MPRSAISSSRTVSDKAVRERNVSTVTDIDISIWHCPDRTGQQTPCFVKGKTGKTGAPGETREHLKSLPLDCKWPAEPMYCRALGDFCGHRYRQRYREVTFLSKAARHRQHNPDEDHRFGSPSFGFGVELILPRNALRQVIGHILPDNRKAQLPKTCGGCQRARGADWHSTTEHLRPL
ncbi:hypothetical protein R20943_02575 [Paraburkholderia aspalathi]|nr:hypothetical protein R20943_02575 [Paraburkholderia aspalathi]